MPRVSPAPRRFSSINSLTGAEAAAGFGIANFSDASLDEPRSLRFGLARMVLLFVPLGLSLGALAFVMVLI